MYSVYQHWDPLKVCVVGRSYPPEFYSWITVPHVRTLFEKIAVETEEDYQALIKKLTEFNVKVLRPDLLEPKLINGKFEPPPMNPRDHMVMIGKVFYTTYGDPTIEGTEQDAYTNITSHIQSQGNLVKSNLPNFQFVNGAELSRIGKDLYFGTRFETQDESQLLDLINSEFVETRNHVVHTGGHSDGVYCPVCPGLIISLRDVPTYAHTFPGWEVVYLPGQSWQKVSAFMELKKKNKGRWWIPGFEKDQAVIDVVEQWLGHWTGYVEETVFDVNMLVVDPKNVIVFNYNKLVFDALNRYGITPHVVPLRHRYFWDGGIHCVTTDLDRDGTEQDFFPSRIR